jgi:hypothetical protein
MRTETGESPWMNIASHCLCLTPTRNRFGKVAETIPWRSSSAATASDFVIRRAPYARTATA